MNNTKNKTVTQGRGVLFDIYYAKISYQYFILWWTRHVYSWKKKHQLNEFVILHKHYQKINMKYSQPCSTVYFLSTWTGWFIEAPEMCICQSLTNYHYFWAGCTNKDNIINLCAPNNILIDIINAFFEGNILIWHVTQQTIISHSKFCFFQNIIPRDTDLIETHISFVFYRHRK